MNKLIWIFSLLIFVGSSAFAQKLKKIKVNEAISVALPPDFELMNDDMYARKYGAYRPPLAMYTDPQGNVDFGVNKTVNRSLLGGASTNWSEEDLKMIKGLYKASIAGMHNDVKFLQDKIATINKKQFIVLEFVGSVKDEETSFQVNTRPRKQYSYIQYAIEEGKILVFNFTCPHEIMPEWRGTAQKVMKSVVIKKF